VYRHNLICAVKHSFIFLDCIQLLAYQMETGTITPELDLLETDIKQLQDLLSNRKLQSIDLVHKYVAQINKYNHYLHAVISVAPQDLLDDAARKMDEEREAGKVRGPLHGIPILIKVRNSQACWLVKC
jgi:Asp-tRNA(Asn)/Glu-tRNA(Gln) amidotransferase A subunit family amidase